jgi:hypothetical protein
MPGSRLDVSRDMFAAEKNFALSLVNQGRAAVDADVNDATKILYSHLLNYIKNTGGDGSIADGYKLVGTGAANSFTVSSGYIYSGGNQAYLSSSVTYNNNGSNTAKRNIHSVVTGITALTLTDSAMKWTVNELAGRSLIANIADGTTFTIASNTATTLTISSGDMTLVAAIRNSYCILPSTPSGVDRTDTVWLNVYLDEIDELDDPDLVHPIAGGYYSAYRLKCRTIVQIEQGSSTYTDYVDADGNQHYFFKLAEIQRYNGVSLIQFADILDKRVAYIGVPPEIWDRVVNEIDLGELEILRPYAHTLPATNRVGVKVGRFNKSTGTETQYFAGGDSPMFGPVSAQPRIDLLMIDDTGALSILAGAEAASPVPPLYPADKLVLAQVLVNETGTVTIVEGDITDVRPFLNLGYGTSFWTLDTGAISATGTYTLKIDKSGSLDLINLSQTGTGKALSIVHTVTGSNPAISLTGSGAGTGSLFSLTQFRSSPAIDLTISGASKGLNLTGGVSANTLIDLTQAGTGKCINLSQNTANNALSISQVGAANAVSVTQSGTGNALQVTQGGAGNGLWVTITGSGVVNRAGLSVMVVSTDVTASAVTVSSVSNHTLIDLAKSGAGAGNVLNIANSGTGYGISLTQAGNSLGMYINKTGVGAGNPLNIANAGTDAGIALSQTGNAYGVYITTSSASYSGLSITQSGNGHAAILSSSATSTVTLSVNTSGAAAGIDSFITNAAGKAGITVWSDSTACPAMYLKPQSIPSTGTYGDGSIFQHATKGLGNKTGGAWRYLGDKSVFRRFGSYTGDGNLAGQVIPPIDLDAHQISLKIYKPLNAGAVMWEWDGVGMNGMDLPYGNVVGTASAWTADGFTVGAWANTIGQAYRYVIYYYI